MEFNEVLLLDFSTGRKILEEKGFRIAKVTYLNQPPGIERIVRIKEKANKLLDVLVTYHKDMDL